MSEYFTVSFEVEKSKTVFERFYKAMIASGVTYKSGFMSFKPESFEDIIRINQNGLNNNRRDDAHFRQIVLDYCDFSEVRVYHMFDEESTMEFHLLIPEYDLWGYTDDVEGYTSDYKTYCKVEKMDSLKNLAMKMWESMEMLSIQTTWEISDDPTHVAYIKEITDVQAQPFAIIKKSLLSDNTESFQTVGQDGVLVEYKDNWCYM